LAFTKGLLSALVLFGAILLLAPILTRCSVENPPPNILIITVDALRADHLEVYGYGRETAPELAELAARGARFEAATVQAPLTVPSLFIMMTGELFYHINIPPGIKTLAERLNEDGYTTAAFIRNPLLELDARGTNRGFDTFYIPQSVMDKGMSEEDFRGAAEKQLYDADLRAETLLSKADEWLRQNLEKEPFFLWIHLFDPHDPYSPPPPYDTRFDKGYQGVVDGDIRRTKDSDNPIWGKIKANPSAEDRKHIVALYDGEVRYVSAQVGAFLERFAEMGLSDRTLIVFSSDHGESLGEHLRWGHGISLYESELRIPLFMVMPGRIPPGIVISQPVESLDIVPTILSLAGVKFDNRFAGNDLTPLFRGRTVESSGVFARGAGEYAYRVDRWKLITRDAGGFELYDLEADPRERQNLASREAQRLRQMHGALQRSSLREIPIDQDTGEPLMEGLRSLGYIE
jgi:arylsulfatase A-like enzyme